MGITKVAHRIRQCAKAWSLWLRTALELRHIEHRNPILVYQMGKVGSSTVTNTLKDLPLSCPVLQVHILSRVEFQRAVARQRELGVRYFDEHLIVSERLIRKLDAGVFPCRVITLTREPISRAISFVFQTVRTRTPDAVRADGSIDREKIATKIVEVLQGGHPAADPGQWFDNELHAVFGIDVFSRPYDFERGYTIFRQADTPVLLMRMEDLDRHLGAALGDFLGLDVPKNGIRNANIGERKWYADDIAWVKRNLRLPREVLLRVVGTRYFQHFYSESRGVVMRRYLKTCDD